MEAYQQNQERIGISSTSTSTEQPGWGPNGFFLDPPTSQAEGPRTPGFPKAVGRQKFPHASIPFNYNTDPELNKSSTHEEGREANHPQAQNAPPEHSHPGATSLPLLYPPLGLLLIQLKKRLTSCGNP